MIIDFREDVRCCDHSLELIQKPDKRLVVLVCVGVGAFEASELFSVEVTHEEKEQKVRVDQDARERYRSRRSTTCSFIRVARILTDWTCPSVAR